MNSPSPVFTPLIDSISWVDSTTAKGGAALPDGESLVSTTLGIRADGNTSFSPGNYQYQFAVAAPAQKETVNDLTTALTKALPPGNYWLAAKQTDKLGDSTADSDWTSEVGFSIPQVAVAPASPTALSVA